jgi:hypothetical protein
MKSLTKNKTNAPEMPDCFACQHFIECQHSSIVSVLHKFVSDLLQRGQCIAERFSAQAIALVRNHSRYRCLDLATIGTCTLNARACLFLAL